ncbi:MAG: hypothetical protein PVI40_09000 [Chlamydiota bacterium]|jgi:pre-rRNA-processing protein TSR3
MHTFPPTVIIRHRKENLKKCSLRGLEKKENFLFFTYPLKNPLPNLNNYICLSMEGPPLTSEDNDKGLILLDGTWTLAQKMEKQIPPGIEKRSIPSNYITAYPRRQTGCIDPQKGLASIEALYVAFHILQRENKDLLDSYFWKELFLKSNF